MTKQAIIYLLVLLVGVAGGTGLGYFMAKSKIDTANTAAAELNAKLSELQTQSEAGLKAAGAKMARLESDAVKSRNDLMRKNTELLRTQTELARAKKVLDQALKGQPTAATPPALKPTTRTSTAAPVVSTAGTREYTIKDGDSLWKIAANELGNGIRYEEILKLNPQITKNTPLTVGTKIKIPAK